MDMGQSSGSSEKCKALSFTTNLAKKDEHIAYIDIKFVQKVTQKSDNIGFAFVQNNQVVDRQEWETDFSTA